MSTIGPLPADRANKERGQGLVEFAMIVPVILLLLAGAVEIAFVANDTLTLGYSAREGARAGSALGSGIAENCLDGQDPSGVDDTVIASVQRILKSPGSAIAISDVQEIRIFKASGTGAKIEDSINVWRFTGPASGPDIEPGEGVNRLDFSPASTPWPACKRSYSASDPDSLGVEVVYLRRLDSPIAALLRAVGGTDAATVTLSEKTVMALNPSY